MTDRRTAYRPRPKPMPGAGPASERDIPTGPVPAPRDVELAMARSRVAQRLCVAGPRSLPGRAPSLLDASPAHDPSLRDRASRPSVSDPAVPAVPFAAAGEDLASEPAGRNPGPEASTDGKAPARSTPDLLADRPVGGRPVDGHPALTSLEHRVEAASTPVAAGSGTDRGTDETPALGTPVSEPPRSTPRSKPAAPEKPAPPPAAARDSGPNVTLADSFADEEKPENESAEWRAPRRVGWRVTGSLSLWVPGLGQWLAGRPTLGLFYASSIGLMIALGWAALATLERSVAVLELFGRSRAAAFWSLAIVYATGCVLYLSNVLTATESAEEHPAYPASPILSGAASLAIPGWGQVINGHRIRATIFLALLLSLTAVGATIHPAARALLERFDLYLPYWDALHRAPTLRWTVPLLVWALAIYDAAASATAQRKARAF